MTAKMYEITLSRNSYWRVYIIWKYVHAEPDRTHYFEKETLESILCPRSLAVDISKDFTFIKYETKRMRLEVQCVNYH